MEACIAATLSDMPQPWLVAMLRLLGSDCQSICSAARVHSRLHHAAVMAMFRIQLRPPRQASCQQQQLASLLHYLSRHGKVVVTISVAGPTKPPQGLLHLDQLLQGLQRLESLSLSDLNLQLTASSSHPGMLLAAPQLTSLKLNYCTLAGGERGLEALLSAATGLHHLGLTSLRGGRGPSGDVLFRQLPEGIQQLQSLTLSVIHVQLAAGNGCQGVLQAATQLTHLQLDNCYVLDGDAGLEAGLAAVTGLQHLRCNDLEDDASTLVRFPVAVLLQLLQLTHLTVAGMAQGDSAVAQHVHCLPALQDLALTWTSAETVTAQALSSLQQLTLLDLCFASIGTSSCYLEPGALAGKARLRSLSQHRMLCPGGAVGVAALLCELQQLTQLTHLHLSNSLKFQACVPSAAAYSALTASSALQYLNLRECSLPDGVWEHIFSADRSLPSLQALDLAYVCDDARLKTCDVTRLVSCCPGLQQLDIAGTKQPAEQLEPLRELHSLQGLVVSAVDDTGVEFLAQLTSLQRLHMWGPSSITDAGLLRLTELQQLTHLIVYSVMLSGYQDTLILYNQVGASK